MTKPTRWTLEEEQSLAKLVKLHTCKEVAEVLGKSYWAVQWKVSCLGLSFRKKGEYNHKGMFKYEDIQRLRRRGARPKEYVAELGCTYNYAKLLSSGAARASA